MNFATVQGERTTERERERERKIITVQRNTTTERDREGSGKNGWKEMKKEM